MQIINIHKEESKVNGRESDKIGRCSVSGKVSAYVHSKGF